MIIKTFRGMIKDDGQEQISLSRNDGRKGYRIVKFVIMPNKEIDDIGAIVKVWAVEQDVVDTEIDFSSSTLLAAALYRQDSGNQFNFAQNVFFDNSVVNQDIFVTYKDDETAGKFVNYYLELEEMDLDLNQATVATLQNIRDIGV